MGLRVSGCTGCELLEYLCSPNVINSYNIHAN